MEKADNQGPALSKKEIIEEIGARTSYSKAKSEGQSTNVANVHELLSPYEFKRSELGKLHCLDQVKASEYGSINPEQYAEFGRHTLPLSL